VLCHAVFRERVADSGTLTFELHFRKAYCCRNLLGPRREPNEVLVARSSGAKVGMRSLKTYFAISLGLCSPRGCILRISAVTVLAPRAAIAPLISVVPVILIVILSTPAWLTWPFLSDARQQTVLRMVDALARWTRGDSVAIGPQGAEAKAFEDV
jgi:hypothetical protein